MSVRVNPVRTRFGIASLLDGGMRIAQPETFAQGEPAISASNPPPTHPLLPSFPASPCYRIPASQRFLPCSSPVLSTYGFHDEASPRPPAATVPAQVAETSCRNSWPLHRSPANAHSPARFW